MKNMSQVRPPRILQEFHLAIERVMEEVGKVIVGQRDVLCQILAAVFSRGHCLLVGVPGLAKTLIVKSIADTMALSFKRIQFTPDLMPSDITGTNVLEELPDGKREFRFVPGPIFANIILADEINRTPPKTQAALLEAMQERQVTVGQQSYPLPEPFFVIATQNPIEQEGTYPLPEAQLDRFMFDIHVDYPSPAEEETILANAGVGRDGRITPIISGRKVLAFQQLVEKIIVPRHVVSYATRLIRSTRPTEPEAPEFIKKFVDWGVGSRAGQHLIMGAKAIAAMDGRPHVAIDDVKQVAVPTLRHRIVANFQAQAEGIDTVQLVQKLLSVVPEPEVPKYSR